MAIGSRGTGSAKPQRRKAHGNEPSGDGLLAEPHQDELLDEGVEETFPASDPVSVKRITGSSVDHRTQAAAGSSTLGGKDRGEAVRAVVLDKARQVTDRARDVLDDAADKVLDVAGEVKATVAGRRREIAERTRRGYERAALRAVDLADDVTQGVKQQPWTSLLVAGAIGLIMGMLLNRRRVEIHYHKD